MNSLREGVVRADSWEFEITSATSEESLLTSEIKDDVGQLVINNGYHSYYTKPYEFCGKLFSLRLFFEFGALKRLILSPYEREPSWERIEESELLASKKRNDDWLSRNFLIIAPISFEWGNLDSVVDKRSQDSYIGIEFK